MRKLKWIPLMILPFLLTGCWDSVEINERHVVLEVAVDKNMNFDESKPVEEQERYKITYTIPDIGKLSGEDSLVEHVKTAITTYSPTIATSIDQVETKTQNTITFSHTKAIVFGEELLKDQSLFGGAVEGLIRNMDMGRSTVVLATKGEGGDITKAENPQNPVTGLYIMKYFNNRERPTSYAKEQYIGNIIKELEETGVTTLPLIATSKEGMPQIKGEAVLENYQLVGWLDKEEVRGATFIEGRIEDVPIVVKYKGEYLTYTIEEETSKIKFNKNANGMVCNILIDTKGSIIEYVSLSDQSIFNEQSIQEITQLIQQEINNQIQVTLNKSKEMNIDFLKIGLEMYRKHPKEWKDYSDNWNNGAYKNFPINVLTNITIKNTGIIE